MPSNISQLAAISSPQTSNPKPEALISNAQPVSQIRPLYRPTSSSTNPLASNPTNSPLSIPLAAPKPTHIQNKTSPTPLADFNKLGGERSPRPMRERGAVERTPSEESWDRDILKPEEDVSGCGCWTVSYLKLGHRVAILIRE
jgi:hypothetical protein